MQNKCDGFRKYFLIRKLRLLSNFGAFFNFRYEMWKMRMYGKFNLSERNIVRATRYIKNE